MLKRILAILASAALLVCAAPAVVAADTSQAEITLSVTASTTAAHPGDTIEFAVKLKQTVPIKTAQFQLDIPEGLTIVEGSSNTETTTPAKLLGLKEGNYEFAEETGILTAYGLAQKGTRENDIVNKDEVILLTFKCKVNDDASGSYEVGFVEDYTEFLNGKLVNDDDVLITSFAYNTAKINVTNAVTGVTVTPTAKTLKEKGETFSITATVAPANATNKAVTYKSSDEKVATVDANGKVTAVANGKATITVTTADGGKTAKCEVTVDIPHKHTMTKVEAKAATCTAEGNNEYYKCTECGKAYKDAEGKTETTVEKETIAKIPHTFDKQDTDDKYLASKADCVSPAKYYYSCSVCGAFDTKTFDVGEKDAENHVNVVVKDEIKATEEADGYTGDKVCEACGTEIEKGTVVPKLVHMADVTKVEAKEATETTDGNIEYYICNSCGKLYKDAEGKTEITLEDTVIKATGKIDEPSQPETPEKPDKPATEKNPTTGAATAAFVTGALALAVVGVMKKKK